MSWGMSVLAISGQTLFVDGFRMDPNAVDGPIVFIQDVLAACLGQGGGGGGTVGEADLVSGLVGGHGRGGLGLGGAVLPVIRPTARGKGREADDDYGKKDGRLHPEDPIQRMPAG